MTMSRYTRTGWLAILGAIAIAACGGSGSGSNVTAGIDRGGVVTSGSITGFGSVHVNGVRYVTSGATFLIDGQPGAESDLRVGQVVRIEGKLDSSGTTGTATRVVFDNEVEGPVQSVDLANGRLVVLGRTVQVGPDTSFDDAFVPRSLDGVTVGERVEVSGFTASDGTVSATRIERKGTQGSYEVKGSVAALDTNARTFQLGTLTVSYATAQLSGFASGQPANGDAVEAIGTLDGAGVFVAARLEKDGEAPGAQDDGADYEGLVTRFVSATDFSVDGQRVTTTSATVYEGGTVANLALDASVEVDGKFNAAGVIVAVKVQFRRTGQLEMAARVDAVDAAAGSLVVLGVTIRTNPLTRFEDHSAADLQQFSLANIAVGDFVEVRAYGDGSGYVATLVERDDAQGGSVEVEGYAQAVATPNFSVNGVAVTTDGNTEFRDNNGVVIGSAAFFQAAASGPLVKVRGTLVGNVVLAERAELED
jgi:hypothetical protein